MDIKNHVKIDTNTTNELHAAKLQAKDGRLATGQKITDTENNDAVSLKITVKPGDTAEAALENIMAASSSITDVAKAEEMIREANRRILEQAGDSVLTQANQTVEVTSELLK